MLRPLSLHKHNKVKNNNGQHIIQYTMVLGIVTVAIMIMGPSIQRYFQGIIKVVADQIGNQANADQDFNSDSGYLISTFIDTDSTTRKRTVDRAGVITYIYDDSITTISNADMDYGFSPE